MRFIFDQPLREKSKKSSAATVRRGRRVAMLVYAQAGATYATLLCGAQRSTCAVGVAGIGRKKKEGDGITPIGTFPLRAALLTTSRYHRRIYAPISRLAMLRTNARAAWCDDPRHHKRYNRPIAMPSKLSHETLHRKDRVYDLIIVIGFNDAPAKAKRGSAIFLHATKKTLSPTEGCIAVEPKALRAMLAKFDHRCAIRISKVQGYKK